MSHDCPNNKQEVRQEVAKQKQQATGNEKIIPFDVCDEFDLTKICHETNMAATMGDDVKSAKISQNVLTAANRLENCEVCLDTGAGASVLKSKDLLNDIRDTEELMTISGIDGRSKGIACDQVGDRIFGTV